MLFSQHLLSALQCSSIHLLDFFCPGTRALMLDCWSSLTCGDAFLPVSFYTHSALVGLSARLLRTCLDAGAPMLDCWRSLTCQDTLFQHLLFPIQCLSIHLLGFFMLALLLRIPSNVSRTATHCYKKPSSTSRYSSTSFACGNNIWYLPHCSYVPDGKASAIIAIYVSFHCSSSCRFSSHFLVANCTWRCI